MKRLALLLLLLATNADARQKWISPRGNDGANCAGTGNPVAGDSLHAFRTFACALCNLSHNDTLRCAPGTYSDGIVNRDYCGLGNVVVIGDSVTPDAVIVPIINLTSETFVTSGQYAPANVSIIGVRVNGSASISEKPSVVGSSVSGFNFRCSNVRDVFAASDADFAMAKCRIGYVSGTSSDSSSMFRIIPAGKTVHARITDVRAWSGPRYPSTWAEGDKALEWWAQDAKSTAAYLTVEATRCTLRVYGCSGWVPAKPFGIDGADHCSFESCIFELVDSTGALNSRGEFALNQGLLFRDRLLNNVWNNCQFIQRTLVSGMGGGKMRLTSPGAVVQGGGNVWRNSTFTSNSQQAEAVGMDWQIQPGDSFYRNVVSCSTSTNRGGFFIHNTVGNAYVGHNTFYNRGTGGAVMINDAGDVCGGQTNCCWTGRLIFHDNILYSHSTGTTANDYSLGIQWPSGSTASSWIDSDYNLYSHYGSATGARSIYAAPCGNLQTLYKPGTGSGTAYASFGLDQHSIYGSPQFVATNTGGDTTFAHFDPTLLPTSAAIGMASDGGSIGAVEFDRTRPYQIQDVSVVKSFPNGVVIGWTATGNDSLTGTCRSYDLRYSTSPLDETTWASATPATGLPAPSISGTRESLTITGLSSGTLYYFAVKASDGPNQSVISATVSTLLPLSGPEVAEP